MRLIDADKLYPDCMTKTGRLAISQSQIAEAPTIEERPHGEEISFYVNGLLNEIQNAPTVEPTFREVVAYECGQKSVERPQGEWRHNSDHPDNLICSVCNCEWDMWRYESKELKFCPNCGADMRGGKK